MRQFSSAGLRLLPTRNSEFGTRNKRATRSHPAAKSPPISVPSSRSLPRFVGVPAVLRSLHRSRFIIPCSSFVFFSPLPPSAVSAISALKPPPARKSHAKLRGKTPIPLATLHNIVAKTRVLRGQSGAVIAHFRAKVAPQSHENGAFCTPRGVFRTPKRPWRVGNSVATPKKRA